MRKGVELPGKEGRWEVLDGRSLQVSVHPFEREVRIRVPESHRVTDIALYARLPDEVSMPTILIGDCLKCRGVAGVYVVIGIGDNDFLDMVLVEKNGETRPAESPVGDWIEEVVRNGKRIWEK